jgi:hypothetical protein
MNEPTAYIPNQVPAQKHRHGCLAAYLVFMIVANSVTALTYVLLSFKDIHMPRWAFPVLTVGGIFNVVCAIALFRWKKWGFWGLAASAVTIFFINLSLGLGTGRALLGFLGLPILYGVLHIGKEGKGWSQLD